MQEGQRKTKFNRYQNIYVDSYIILKIMELRNKKQFATYRDTTEIRVKIGHSDVLPSHSPDT